MLDRVLMNDDWELNIQMGCVSMSSRLAQTTHPYFCSQTRQFRKERDAFASNRCGSIVRNVNRLSVNLGSRTILEVEPKACGQKLEDVERVS